ncbi:hypothetical protein DFR49_2124 [Hephaestia caeni]|uniref:Uncharacterized protein n=1 Tax=Hephaestia caeni TaxID=645617 RepID=A0A397P6I9_9SPHN|nr:hypothetical protein [Hephaestia caeni]RIA43893.1 hypothetical protein DFR49_2124 [Hephaestia caeni]
MSVQISEVSTTATSPLGAVSFHVSGSSGITIDVSQTEVPALPKGMVVDGVMLICIHIATPVTREFPVQLTASVGCNGDAETGEWLESMAFPSDDGVLQVAMRDTEWLAANGVTAEPVQYQRQGFYQIISNAPAATTLYVSVAWRVDDRAAAANDASTWFAADLTLPS